MSNLKKLAQVMGAALLMSLLSACASDTTTPTPQIPTSSPTLPATKTIAATSTPMPFPTPIPTATTERLDLWADVTDSTIGDTLEYTNKVELADLNGDGLVDLLFANGGAYNAAGPPELSRVFLNQGPGEMFKEVTEDIFDPDGMSAKVIKVRDVNGDDHVDILVGTSYQTQSRLYLGDGSGHFTEATQTHLPQFNASIGDLEFGDADGDGDLDVVLADWGPGDPLSGNGGRTMLWLNDGQGHFTDATEARMPDVLVRFSFDLEFVDVDNDYDLDILVACLFCAEGFPTPGSLLFHNDGSGTFTDVSGERLPQWPKNYDFEAMDMNGDGYLDLVAVSYHNLGEHLLINDQTGGFEEATAELWPASDNLGHDDAIAVFLDYDSDGDADFLIGSIDGPDRLLINDGSGNLRMAESVFGGTPTKTCDMAVGDLNGDGRLDVVQTQCPHPGAEDERVYFGSNIQPDTAPPMITMVEEVSVSGSGQPVQVRARIHDNKSPTVPHDWQAVVLRWTAAGQTRESPMEWYGGYLWRGVLDEHTDNLSYQICATDAAGNEACSQLVVTD